MVFVLVIVLAILGATFGSKFVLDLQSSEDVRDEVRNGILHICENQHDFFINYSKRTKKTEQRLKAALQTNESILTAFQDISPNKVWEPVNEAIDKENKLIVSSLTIIQPISVPDCNNLANAISELKGE